MDCRTHTRYVSAQHRCLDPVNRDFPLNSWRRCRIINRDQTIHGLEVSSNSFGFTGQYLQVITGNLDLDFLADRRPCLLFSNLSTYAWNIF